jgi:squalene-associated FAD-dependent desaturase
MHYAEANGSQPTVAIVGGGLAGLAAAAAAVAQGLRVELFEVRRRLGGRAGSFLDPQTHTVVDFCQHVAMGCCTNLLDFCRRTGIADRLQPATKLNFVGPDGRMHAFAPTSWLPAPLHLMPALLRLGYLTRRQRWGIAAALHRLAHAASANGSEEETAGGWLRRHGQSQPTIDRFWSVVLNSALGETVDRVSLRAARKVFVDGFLSSRHAWELYLPQSPLGEILDGPVKTWLTERGVTLCLGSRVIEIEFESDRATALVLPDGRRRRFDFVIVAVPWHQLGALFPQTLASLMPTVAEAAVGMQPAPITAVHLWFDRPPGPVPHAVLVGRTSQWVFMPVREDCVAGRRAYYCQVVISASYGLLGRPAQAVLDEVRKDLESVWPAARAAELLHGRVLTHRAAVFSMAPQFDRLRPAQQTPVANLMLAGDWTATGWPATMESAVRSGYLAAEGVLDALDRPGGLLAADLPPSRLARMLFGLF